MEKNKIGSSGKKSLRPRSRIIRTMGDELISSETVAVAELVKNAYDADATKVMVRIINDDEISKIEIMDNGHGMSLDTILSIWMEPATLFRKNNKYSKIFERRVLGEKGIGRFAASRLADKIELITRETGTKNEVRVLIDWRDFDNEDKFLDEIEISWEESLPKEIKPEGTIHYLFKDIDDYNKSDLEHGTILRMELLRSNWNIREEFLNLRSALSKLVSPFFEADLHAHKDEFRIRIEVPQQFEDISGLVEPPEAIRNPHYTISGLINDKGEYDLRMKIIGDVKEKKISGIFKMKYGGIPNCGAFSVDFRVWDRDIDSLKSVAKKYDKTVSDFRRDLNDAAGISIYRDGFRVLPYGEPRNDWLRLDMRRVQNPTLRLSNNQIVGYISISADQNPELCDQSNREGLIEGQSLNDFRELVIKVLAELEPIRYSKKPRKEKSRDSEEGLFSGFEIGSIVEMTRKKYPDDGELLTLVKEKKKAIDWKVEEVKEVLARYRRLATLGQLIDTVLHDGRTPITKISNESYEGLRDISQKRVDTDNLIDKVKEHFKMIRLQSDLLATLLRRIEPFGGRKRGRPKKVYLEIIIKETFSVFETQINEESVIIKLPSPKTQVTVDESEMKEVIINLLDNSLYWLKNVSKKDRQITVDVNRIDSKEVEILFSDNGPGIEPEFQERIFEPYFSRKPNGIGLGLAIAGEIVSDYYGGQLELIGTDEVEGATFRITLKRRI